MSSTIVTTLAPAAHPFYEAGKRMQTPPTPAAKSAGKKGPDISVLHCLNSACNGLLAYEVDSQNVLYVDLAWTATSDGRKRYFPCPKCGGKNIVEEIRSDTGQLKHRVTRWEP